MADHSRNGVRGLIGALELVGSAVDPTDPIASEQLQSAVRYLRFLGERLDHLYDRERFELRHHLDMGDRLLAASLDDHDTGDLSAFVILGHDLLERVGANVPEMRACTAALAAAITALVRAVAGAAAPMRTTVERIVLEATEERIMFERAWYLPLGFDHSAADVPAIELVLARERELQAARRAATQGG